MFKKIDLFQKRYMQITLAFMIFVALERYGHVPHDVWIVLTSAMIYSGFNPSTVLKRAYLRFIGTIVGISAVAIIWHFIHFDFRLMIIFLVMLIWAMVFFANLPYNYYVIPITVFSDLLIEVSNSESFTLQYYIFDRFICTLIVFAGCILIEQLWFGSSNMTDLNYHYSCQKIRNNLIDLYKSTEANTLTKTQMFKKIQALRQQIIDLSLLIENQKYEFGRKKLFLKLDSETMLTLVRTELRHIICLYYLKNKNGEINQISALRDKINHSLNQRLETLLKKKSL